MSSSQQQQQQREKADDEHQPLNKPCRHHRHRQTIPNLIQFRDSFERTDFCLFSKSKIQHQHQQSYYVRLMVRNVYIYSSHQVSYFKKMLLLLLLLLLFILHRRSQLSRLCRNNQTADAVSRLER